MPPTAAPRVLLTIPAYWPAVAYGGPVRKARGLAEALAAAGADVTVLTSTMLDLRRRLSRRTVERAVGPVRVVYLATPLRYRWNPVCPGAPSWCRANLPGFDVVHVMGYRDTIGLAASRAAARRGIPVVFEPLGMFRPSHRSLAAKRLYDRTLGGPLSRSAGALVATSSLERAELVSAGLDPARVVVRPNGVDVEDLERLPARGSLRAELGIGPRSPLVLFLGRVSRQKGLPMLVGALAGDGGTRLVVAGPDDADGAREELLRAARAEGVVDRVSFTGPLDREGVRRALADADALALPSAGESFGNAAAEAVAAGVPVVLTDRCGVAEFLGEAALVVPYRAADVAAGVRRVLTDEALRGRMAAARAGVVASLRWEAVAASQLELYRRLLDPRPAS
jgi:glycosyltransferase involved in cell wall biosynthesis